MIDETTTYTHEHTPNADHLPNGPQDIIDSIGSIDLNTLSIEASELLKTFSESDQLIEVMRKISNSQIDLNTLPEHTLGLLQLLCENGFAAEVMRLISDGSLILANLDTQVLVLLDVLCENGQAAEVMGRVADESINLTTLSDQTSTLLQSLSLNGQAAEVMKLIHNESIDIEALSYRSVVLLAILCENGQAAEVMGRVSDESIDLTILDYRDSVLLRSLSENGQAAEVITLIFQRPINFATITVPSINLLKSLSSNGQAEAVMRLIPRLAIDLTTLSDQTSTLLRSLCENGQAVEVMGRVAGESINLTILKEPASTLLQSLSLNGQAAEVMKLIHNESIDIEAIPNRSVVLLKYLCENGQAAEVMRRVADEPIDLTILSYRDSVLLRSLSENGQAEAVMRLIPRLAIDLTTLSDQTSTLLRSLCENGQAEAVVRLISGELIDIHTLSTQASELIQSLYKNGQEDLILDSISGINLDTINLSSLAFLVGIIDLGGAEKIIDKFLTIANNVLSNDATEVFIYLSLNGQAKRVMQIIATLDLSGVDIHLKQRLFSTLCSNGQKDSLESFLKFVGLEDYEKNCYIFVDTAQKRIQSQPNVDGDASTQAEVPEDGVGKEIPLGVRTTAIQLITKINSFRDSSDVKESIILTLKKLLLQYPELFQDIKPLLKGMSLGVISTFFSENRQTSDQQGENDSDVVDYKYENWFLCEESESRLKRSISERACVLVNGKLLVKFVGRISALCLESFSVGGSTFVAGHWYCPVSDRTVDSLKQSFVLGEFRLEGSMGRWAYMRPMYSYLKDQGSQELDILLKNAQTFASKNKAVMPELNMEARKAYRYKESEE